MRPPLGLGEPGQHAQQRRLAAARGAHQGEHLALVDPQIDAVDGGECAEGLVDAFDDDLRLGVGIEPGPVGQSISAASTARRVLEIRRRRCAAPLRREKRPLHHLGRDMRRSHTSSRFK